MSERFNFSFFLKLKLGALVWAVLSTVALLFAATQAGDKTTVRWLLLVAVVAIVASAVEGGLYLVRMHWAVTDDERAAAHHEVVIDKFRFWFWMVMLIGVAIAAAVIRLL